MMKRETPPDEENLVVDHEQEQEMSTTKQYVRRGGSTLESAMLKFDNMKFVAGKGKREKIIVQDVSATVTKGRECLVFTPCYMIVAKRPSVLGSHEKMLSAYMQKKRARPRLTL